MSYLKAKVLEVTQRSDRNTGEIINRVQLEVISHESSRLPVDAAVIQAYQTSKGQTMLVPAEFRVIDGRSFLVLTGDGYPIPFTERANTQSQPLAQSNDSIEKPRTGNALFGGNK